MLCGACEQDLADSQYCTGGGGGAFALKSCPACSQQQGRHVFYPPEAFGYREIGGRTYVQSHRTACRNEVSPSAPACNC